MNIIVIGGAGFIGSHLAENLYKAGYNITVIDNLSTGDRRNLDKNIQLIELDIRDHNKMRDAFHKIRPEVIFHLSAQIDVGKSWQFPSLDADVNINGTLNILEFAVEAGTRKIIFSSSGGAIYGNVVNGLAHEEQFPAPVSPYGVAKLAAEFYFQAFSVQYGLKFTSLRYSNVYGPRQGLKGEGGVIAIFAKHFLQGEKITIYGDGKQTRDFVYVSDVVQANMLALSKGDNQIINISSGQDVSIAEVYKSFANITKSELPIIYDVPRQGDVGRSCLNNQKAYEVLGWKPNVTFSDGIKYTLETMEKNLIVERS